LNILIVKEVFLFKKYAFLFVHFQVRSYNPETSFGEHQFFIYINAQDAQIVHLPIVPTRLGDIHVTVHASTLIGKDTITRKLHVEVSVLTAAYTVLSCLNFLVPLTTHSLFTVFDYWVNNTVWCRGL
jgi:hypothetical protein